MHRTKKEMTPIMESMLDCIPQSIVAGGVGQLATLGAFTQNDKCQQHELQMLCCVKPQRSLAFLINRGIEA